MVDNGNRHVLAEDLEYILLNTRDLWSDLAGKQIFITGGTGFHGCWLLESFIWANRILNLNSHVVVLTRDPDAFALKAPHLAQDPSVKLIIGDVCSFDFPQGSFSHIIHAATDTDTRLNAQNPLQMVRTIVDGTRRTLEFARHCRARKLLFTSSGAVYGKQAADVNHVPEQYSGGPDPIDPLSAYAESKRIAEHLCVLYSRQYDIEVKIARGFAFIGPYMLNSHFAVVSFIQDVISGRPIQVNSDGTSCRSYLYAADLAVWLWTILVRGERCRPYNVGSEESLTISQLAHLVAETLQTSTEIKILGHPCFGMNAERYVPSTFRARSELGLREHIDLAEAVRRTARWFVQKTSAYRQEHQPA
jgi:nucleoside-diphosphate-sugar epimerase